MTSTDQPVVLSLSPAALSVRATPITRYIRIVSGFPMTVTGKIQKFKIRDEMKSQLGLEDEKTA